MARVHSQTGNLPWIDRVHKAIADEKLLGITCQLYSKKQPNRNSLPSEPCLCGRLPRRHSFNSSKPKTERIADGHWKSIRHAKQSIVTVYGIWNNKTKVFLFELFYSYLFSSN